jgi:hypothetical protein
VNVKHHAAAVDILDLEVHRLLEPKTAGVCGGGRTPCCGGRRRRRRFGGPLRLRARVSQQRSGQPFATDYRARRCGRCNGAKSVARCVSTAAKPEP